MSLKTNLMQPNFEIINQVEGGDKRSKARMKELQKHVDLSSGGLPAMNSSNYQSAKKGPKGDRGGMSFVEDGREKYD